MKKLVSVLLAAALSLSMLPLCAVSESVERSLNENVIIDTDPEGGYTGDYVVIYNPSSNIIAPGSTGSLEGKIITSVAAKAEGDGFVCENSFVCGTDLSESIPDDYEPVFVKTDYPVGSTRFFQIVGDNPNPDGGPIEFKVLHVGEHCRIWTPTDPAYLPIDVADPEYASYAADEFDSKFDLLTSTFGDFWDTNEDGKVNILFHAMTGGTSGGFFSQNDFFNGNNLPIIHVRTYDGILDTDYNCRVVVHEFQHLINFSVTYANGGHMQIWLNEAFSGAAENMCYPNGHMAIERIFQWMNYTPVYFDFFMPRAEIEYTFSYPLHKGGSLISTWNNSELGYLARYGEVFLFSQFLSTNFGGPGIYRQILERVSGSEAQDTLDALTETVGLSMEEIWQWFFTSLVANDLGSGYGFAMNENYDGLFYYSPTVYHMLCPVIYTSTEAAYIYGGGFITVKPVGRNFVPPADASSSLRYIGITAQGLDPRPTSETVWDFETNPYFSGWEFFDLDGDDHNWVWYVREPDSGFVIHEGLGYLYSCSWTQAGALTPDNIAVTPLFTVPNNGEFSLWAASQSANYTNEVFGVYLYDGGLMERIGEDVLVTHEDTRYSFDLSAYAGQNIRLAIRHYNCTDQFVLNVDYVEVNGDPFNTAGDVDGDGAVTVNDALICLRGAMGLVGLTPMETAACDVNGDGNVDVTDALMILRFAMGLISGF